MDLDGSLLSLDRAGYVIVQSVLPPDQLEYLRSAVDDICASERSAGTDYAYGGANQRVWCLPRFGRTFLDLAQHPVARLLMSHVLGSDYLLSNLTAHLLGPGGRAMLPHWDQSWAPRPWPYPVVAQVIWMLDDFTVSNGSTELVAGSHLVNEAGARALPAERAVAPAGSCLAYDGRLLHAAPTNTSDRPRRAVLAYYCRGWVRQQENFSQSLGRELQETLTLDERRLLGLDYCGYANMVIGPPPGLERY